MSICLKLGALCALCACLVALPQNAAAEEDAAPEFHWPADSGALDEFDSIHLLPHRENKAPGFILGDSHGFLRVFEERDGQIEEAWISEFLEGGIGGILIADVNDDGLDEIVVYTDRGREPIPHDSWSGRTFIEGTRPLERTPDNGHRFMHPLIWSLQADPAQPPEPMVELEIEAYGTLGE